jgi:hypothetical protein
MLSRLILMSLMALITRSAVCAADERSEVDREILGVWQLKFTTPDGIVRDPVVIVGRQYEQYLAWQVVGGEAEPFKSARLKGEKLTLVIEPSQEPDVTVTLEVELDEENRCTGTGSFRSRSDGETGQWGLTGKRLTRSDFEEYQTWKLEFETPDYERHSPLVTVVSLDGQRYAWYQGRDHDLPARSFKLDGNRVELVVAGQTGEGTPIEVTFRGQLEGERVKGAASFKLGGESGEFPFEGRPNSESK